jgi:LacI family transcriptional regulator
MLGRRVTLRDVADRAGVHPSTASRAINEHTRSLVDDQTVDRVLQAANDLGYEPDSLARALKTNRTHTVGMLLPDLTNPLFPPIVRGIEDGLGGASYTLILGNTDNDPVKERTVLSALLGRRIDGLILATTEREPSPAIAELMDGGLPTILVNRTIDDPTVPSVLGDDRVGIALAVDHLVGLGHTRIAHVAGPQQTSTGLLRHDSFVASMQRAGLAVDRDRIVFADWFREVPGAEACRTLLDRRPDTTAIVAANDLIAMGCYDVANERDLQIGVDLSVVGYNDMLFADKLCPPMTTVRVPHYQLGLRAAQMVLNLINDPDAAPEQVRLEPTLVRRASTGPP